MSILEDILGSMDHLATGEESEEERRRRLSQEQRMPASATASSSSKRGGGARASSLTTTTTTSTIPSHAITATSFDASNPFDLLQAEGATEDGGEAEDQSEEEASKGNQRKRKKRKRHNHREGSDSLSRVVIVKRKRPPADHLASTLALIPSPQRMHVSCFSVRMVVVMEAWMMDSFC